MKIRNLFVATACLAVIGFVSEQSLAQGPNNLFSQYYTQPGASQANAEMYPAPHPVPRHVGQTYYTYQPLMPHEMMYEHQRNYYNYYATPESFYCDQCPGVDSRYRGGYGLTKTSVRWQSGCNSVAPLPGISLPFMKANYWLSKQYSVPRGCIQKLGSNFLGGVGSGSGCGCAGGTCSGGGGYADYSSRYDDTESCSSCESYAANWQQAYQQSAARTAAEMQNRFSR